MRINTIAGKLKLSFVVFLLTFILSAVFVISKDHQAEKVEHFLIENTYPEVLLVHRLKFHTVQVQQWLTDISATRGQDGLNDGFDEAEQHAREFHAILGQIRNLDPHISPRLDELEMAFSPYYETGKRMAQAYVEQGPAGGNKMMTEFDTVAETINNKVETLLNDRVAQINLNWETYNTTKSHIFIAIGITIVFLIAIAVYFVQNIRVILSALAEISGEFTLLGARICGGGRRGPYPGFPYSGCHR